METLNLLTPEERLDLIVNYFENYLKCIRIENYIPDINFINFNEILNSLLKSFSLHLDFDGSLHFFTNMSPTHTIIGFLRFGSVPEILQKAIMKVNGYALEELKQNPNYIGVQLC